MMTMIHRALAAPFITAPPVRIRPNSDIYIDIDIDVDTPQIVINDLDVRMMTTMIHRALAAPFSTAPPVRIRPNSDR